MNYYQIKELLRDAYNAGKDSESFNAQLARKIEEGVKSYPAEMSFARHFENLLIKQDWGSSPTSENTERFQMPTDDQLIKMAILFNDSKAEPEKLSNMVAMCTLIIDRLYENGDILIPTLKEEE